MVCASIQGDLLSGAELRLAIAADPDQAWLAEAGGRPLVALVLRAAGEAPHGYAPGAGAPPPSPAAQCLRQGVEFVVAKAGF